MDGPQRRNTQSTGNGRDAPFGQPEPASLAGVRWYQSVGARTGTVTTLSDDPSANLKELLDVEYGDPWEFALRLCGAAIAAGLMLVYTGLIAAIIWVAAYAGSHLLHYSVIRAGLRSPGRGFVWAAGLCYLVVLATFLWLPIKLAVQADPILMFSGMLLIAMTMVFHIRRADMMMWLVLGQVGVLGAALVAIVALRWADFDGTVPKFGALLVSGFALMFLTRAMFATRRFRIETARAAVRLAQEKEVSAIGRFAGGIAHDFNNTLTVVLGNLELYHELKGREDKDAAVAEAERAARRAEMVVQQLLIYARKAPTQRVRQDCNVVVADAVADLAARIPEGLNTDLALTENSLCVVADKQQITAAVESLIKNAVDAMDDRGTLRIETALVFLDTSRTLIDGAVLMPGGYIEIVVIDTGHGIDESILPRVTEPFFTTRAPGQGSGLGLSMVMGFAHEAGGGLHISSDKTGTTAILFLPQAPPHEVRVVPAASKPVPPTKNAAL